MLFILFRWLFDFNLADFVDFLNGFRESNLFDSIPCSLTLFGYSWSTRPRFIISFAWKICWVWSPDWLIAWCLEITGSSSVRPTNFEIDLCNALVVCGLRLFVAWVLVVTSPYVLLIGLNVQLSIAFRSLIYLACSSLFLRWLSHLRFLRYIFSSDCLFLRTFFFGCCLTGCCRF